MSFGNTFENDLLALIFNATGIGNIADNAGSSPLTNLYVVAAYRRPGRGWQLRRRVSAPTPTMPVSRRGAVGCGLGRDRKQRVSGGGRRLSRRSDTGGETITHFSVGTLQRAAQPRSSPMAPIRPTSWSRQVSRRS
jgi:hypothetical protein